MSWSVLPQLPRKIRAVAPVARTYCTLFSSVARSTHLIPFVGNAAQGSCNVGHQPGGQHRHSVVQGSSGVV